MIKRLGKKFVVMLLAFACLNGGIGAAYYNYLQPLRQEEEQNLQTTKAAVEAKRLEVAKMKEEFVLLQSQLRNFKELEYDGFFNNQNRSNAIDLLTDLSKKAGLLKARVKVGKGELIADPQADMAKQVVLRSEINIPTDSLDDVDVYTFLKFVERSFPGSIDVTKIKMDRKEILNAAMLRKIGSGDPSPLVQSEITFDWFTMIPKDTTAPAEKGN